MTRTTMSRLCLVGVSLMVLAGNVRADDSPTGNSIISQQGDAQSRARWAADPSYSPPKPVNVSSGASPSASAPRSVPIASPTRPLPTPTPAPALTGVASAATLPAPRAVAPATSLVTPVAIPPIQQSSHRGRWILLGIFVVLIAVSYAVR